MENLIPADDFCTYYKVEYSFINSLEEYGLIELIRTEKTKFIDINKLHDLEKLVRLHYDLDINLEGIEAITHLLQRVEDMQQEIILLRNKLSLYEQTL
ncbi:MAG: chaperone modulator CbpM [Chitinophagaceae bacterium]|nr:chaperone modulator CbpM [Chitinophagaceae bacterium]